MISDSRRILSTPTTERHHPRNTVCNFTAFSAILYRKLINFILTSTAEGYRGSLIPQGKATAKKLKQDLEDVCNAFYELIPFDFGLKRPEMIDTMEKVRAKFDMLDVMSDVAEAMDILKNPQGGDGWFVEAYGAIGLVLMSLSIPEKKPKVERVYDEIGCDIAPLSENDAKYQMIAEYIDQTSKGHATARKLKNVFKVQRLEEIDKFSPYVEERNKFTVGPLPFLVDKTVA